jgi:hypothetical protein
MLYLLLTCFTAADMLLLAADEQFNKVRHQLQMLPCPNTNRLDSHANLKIKNQASCPDAGLPLVA